MGCLFLDNPKGLVGVGRVRPRSTAGRVSSPVAKTLPPRRVMCAHMARTAIVRRHRCRHPPVLVLLVVLRAVRVLVLGHVQVVIIVMLLLLLLALCNPSLPQAML